MSKKMTYVEFGERVIDILHGLEEFPDQKELIKKAEDLVSSHRVKSEKAKERSAQKEKTSKVSQKTLDNAKAVKAVLSSEPMTSDEIAIAAKNPNLTALLVANAVKYIDGVEKTKVRREKVNSKGLKAEKEYTAYFIAQ